MVVKSAPAAPFLSTRAIYPKFDDAIAALREVSQAVRAQVAAAARENIVVIAHSDFDDEDLDLEIGVTLNRQVNKPVRLPSQVQLGLSGAAGQRQRWRPSCAAGPLYQSHLAFGKLGVWMEANGYRIAGPCREVFLDMPFQVPARTIPPSRSSSR